MTRGFVAEHGTPDLRRRLRRTTIRFRTGAARRQPLVRAGAEGRALVPGGLRRLVAGRRCPAADGDAGRPRWPRATAWPTGAAQRTLLAGGAAPGRSENVVRLMTGRDPAPCFRLMAARPGASEPQMRLAGALQLFGTGWRLRQGDTAGPLSTEGWASIFVRLPPSRHHRLSVAVEPIPHDVISRLSVEANGQPILRRGRPSDGPLHLSGVVPAAALAATDGLAKLTVRLSDQRGRPSGDAAVNRIDITPFASRPESVLARQAAPPRQQHHWQRRT
jgi:hypothetical protein